jgi:hypothetical protein
MLPWCGGDPVTAAQRTAEIAPGTWCTPTGPYLEQPDDTARSARPPPVAAGGDVCACGHMEVVHHLTSTAKRRTYCLHQDATGQCPCTVYMRVEEVADASVHTAEADRHAATEPADAARATVGPKRRPAGTRRAVATRPAGVAGPGFGAAAIDAGPGPQALW